MTSIFGFGRDRVWSLFSSKDVEPNRDTDQREIDQRGIVESHSGHKRKLSSSPEPELEHRLKKLRLDLKDVNNGTGGRGLAMVEAVLKGSDDESIFVTIDGDPSEIVAKAARGERKARDIVGYESDEEFADVMLHEDQEGMWDEREMEPAKHVTADDEDFEGWSQQELDFFNALNDRGIIPMFWSYWKVDFPTLPDNLFTAEKEDALITNWKGNAAAGAKAFTALIQAGVDARERHKRGNNAAQLLAKEISAYIKWSYRDAKILNDSYLPLVVVNFAHNNDDLEAADERTHRRVRKLCDKYLRLWKDAMPNFQSPSPTIFHVFLARTVMAIGSYDTSAEDPEFRNIFFADWRNRGDDLWNAMAIAILVQQTRSWLMKVDPRRKHRKKSPAIDPDL